MCFSRLILLLLLLLLVLLESTRWRVLNAYALPPKISRYFMAKG